MTDSTDPDGLAPIDLPIARECPFDPPAELGRIRDEHPICPLHYPDDHLGWLVSNYHLGRALLGDSRFSVRHPHLVIGDGYQNARLEDLVDREHPEMRVGNLLEVDPPEHVRLRRLQAGYFTVQRVAEYREDIEEIVSDRLDAFEAVGSPVDFVKEFAYPVPSLALCSMLGIPAEDRERFERPTAEVADFGTTADERIGPLRELFDYAKRVVDRKRARPTGDIISELIQGGQMTDDEIVGATSFIFSAGHETTATMFGFAAFALLSDRSRWEYLLANPERIDNAVEELLRYLTIFHVGAVPRTATEDLEFEGVRIKKGANVTVSLAGANRDPLQYPEPDVLDLDRDTGRHLAFGSGRHICLGQHLARLELQIGFRALTERFPTLRLAVGTDRVPMRPFDVGAYGVDSLPVEW